MRVIVLMLAGGPRVTRRGRPRLPWCAQGGPCVPIDAWSVSVTSVSRVVQNLRSTDRAFASIFGVSTQVCAPDQKSCFVSSRDDIWGSADPPHLRFSVFWISTTRRDITRRTQGPILFKLSILFKSSNIVGTFTRENQKGN